MSLWIFILSLSREKLIIFFLNILAENKNKQTEVCNLRRLLHTRIVTRIVEKDMKVAVCLWHEVELCNFIINGGS